MSNRITVGADGRPGPHPDQLPSLASQAARQRSADLHHLLVQSGVALAIMAIFCVALGWLVAGRLLRPLRTITATTRRISASSLHQRLALAGPADELKELGDTIDALLDRLERAFAAQRQFIANASHELRTPLTLQRALLEAALSDPAPTHDSWQSTGRRAVAAGEHQERLIDALLTLARGEAGPERWEPADLAAITGHMLSTRITETEHGGLHLTTGLEPAPTSGDPRLIERLVANLADNAIRHNVPAGRIEVRTGRRAGRAVLSITNSGPVVAAAEVDRLFQPFQRSAGQRRHDGGLGLGLSIVRAIATAHDASVTVHPRPGGGLQVDVAFPAVAPPATWPTPGAEQGPGGPARTGTGRRCGGAPTTGSGDG